MNRAGKLHALLSTARVANVPSVVSNVWLGVVIWALVTYHSNSDGVGRLPEIAWGEVARLVMAGISLYVSGNFFNDWMDRNWDAERRPERALPRGIFTPGLYQNVALGLAVMGVAIAATVNAFAGIVATAITGCIVIYTVWHKRSAWAVVPMGLCRGLLPVMGALGMIGEKSTIPVSFTGVAVYSGAAGTALLCYIVGLSLSARNESKEGREMPTRMPRILFVAAGMLMLVPFFFSNAAFLRSGKAFVLGFDGVVAYAVWLWLCHTVFRKPISRHVSALLAGIPLLDWILLLPTYLLLVFGGQGHGWLAFSCLILPPLGFIAALLLQRLAPAT